MTERWEYMLLNFENLSADALEERLNQFGEGGWEAFAYVGYQSLSSIVLKRPKTESPDDEEPPSDEDIKIY